MVLPLELLANKEDELVGGSYGNGRIASRIGSIELTTLEEQGWPVLKTVTGDKPRTLGRLAWRLRNAMAHFNITFYLQHGSISEVKLWDKEKNEVTGRYQTVWSTVVSVSDLYSLFEKILTRISKSELVLQR
jgi:hypothetical protein